MYIFEVYSGLISPVSDLTINEYAEMKEIASKVYLEASINGKFDYTMFDLNE